MSQYFGWWDLDQNGPAMKNIVTGERIRFVERLPKIGEISNGSLLCFYYEHEDLQLPIYVVAGRRSGDGGAKDDYWTLDYVKSVGEWSERESEQVPPYGIWRRLDDCLTDCLACFPEREVNDGTAVKWLEVVGGWLNGQWHPSLFRRIRRLTAKEMAELKSGNEGKDSRLDAQFDPWICSLDANPPSPWQFHKYSSKVSVESEHNLKSGILLDGLRVEPTEDYRRKLVFPASFDFSGLDGRMAYLLSDDARQLLYPYQAQRKQESHRTHGSGFVRLLYADENVVCEFTAYPTGPREHLTWGIDTFYSAFGNRREPNGRSSAPSTMIHLQREPNRSTWLQMKWILTDAWLQWCGTTARSPLWVEELRLDAADAIDLRGSFVGGIPVNYLISRVRAQPY